MVGVFLRGLDLSVWSRLSLCVCVFVHMLSVDQARNARARDVTLKTRPLLAGLNFPLTSTLSVCPMSCASQVRFVPIALGLGSV